MFSALDIAGSGMGVSETWMSAIGDNIANVNTVRPTSSAAYQTRFVVAQSVGGGPTAPASPAAQIGSGVAVQSITFSPAQGQLRYDPTNPIADRAGMVRGNSVDLAAQMSDLIMAQRGFQANVSSVKAAREAYQSALGLKL